ncbi:metallophosphoesterase [Nocardia takedensis]
MVRVAVVAVLLGSVHLLLHRRLVRATGMTGRWARVTDGVLVLGWASAVTAAAVGTVAPVAWIRPVGFAGLTWMAAVFYLVLGLAVLGIVLLVLRVAGRPAPSVRLRWLRAATGVLVVAAIGTALYGVGEAAEPRMVHAKVALPDLPPEFDGVRVAVLSDLHVGPARGAGFTREVVDMVGAQRPDLIAIVGDLADGTIEHVGEDLRPLADLTAPLGVYGVAGNHEQISDDVGDWLSYWESLGITALRNSRVEVRRDAGVVDVAGTYDYSAEAPYEPDLGAALAGRDPARFVLLLAHQPKQVDDAAAAGVDLQVSGHTHGGQMWPLRHVVEWVHDTEITGFDTVGDTTLFTTYGAGAWGPPVRVGAPPEVVILELTRPS